MGDGRRRIPLQEQAEPEVEPGLVELGPRAPVFLGAFRDDEGALRAAVETALETSDLVMLSGGTSKGEGDLNARVVSELDPGIVVHGVALKPGKPTRNAPGAGANAK